MTEDEQAARIDRRALLRRAGFTAAAVGGAAAAGAALTGTAEAAANDPVLMAQSNDAGSFVTGLGTSATTGAALVLSNSGTAHGPLQLLSSDAAVFNSVGLHQGELFQVNGDLFFVSVDSATPGGPVAGIVYNSANATQQVAIVPKRFLDTRSEDGRANIVTATLDSAGRVKAGTWLVLDLTEIGFYLSVIGNVTAVAPVGGGFLTVNPTPLVGPPTTSTVNYANAQVLSNSFLVAANPDDGSIALYSSKTCHVVLDVTGVNTPDQGFVNVPVPGLSPAARERWRAALRQN